MTSEEYLEECGWYRRHVLPNGTRMWSRGEQGEWPRYWTTAEAVDLQVERDRERFCFVVKRMEESDERQEQQQ